MLLMTGVAGLLVVTDVLIFALSKARYQPPPPPRPVVRPTPRPLMPPPYDPLTDNDVERLIRLLSNKEEHGNGEIRARAARRLGQLNDEAALPVLLEMLNDATAFSSPEIRQACAWALGNLRNPTAVPGLTLALRAGNSEAITALEKIGAPEAVDALTAFLSDLAKSNRADDHPQQWAIATTLGKMKDKRAVPALVALLQQRNSGDPHTDPVFATVTALGDIGDTTAVPALLSLDRGPPALKTQMAIAIEKILLSHRTITPALVEHFDDPANLHGWTLEDGFARSIRLKDGGLSIFSSQVGDQVESYPQGRWTGEWIARARLRFLKGSGHPAGVLLFGKQDERLYRYSLAQERQRGKDPSWKATVTRITGNTEETLLTQALAPYHAGWNLLMVRNVDTVVSMILNDVYLGSFRAPELDGQIGLGVANDNHALFDDFQIDRVERERTVIAEQEQLQAKATEQHMLTRTTSEQAEELTPPMWYRVVRRIPVRAHPSSEAERVAWAHEGMTICVVSVTGQWLEVHSTKNRPPGFIHRTDAESTGRSCLEKR